MTLRMLIAAIVVRTYFVLYHAAHYLYCLHVLNFYELLVIYVLLNTHVL